MEGFRLGPIDLGVSWKLLMHPAIKALDFPSLPMVQCDRCWMASCGYFDARAKCCTIYPIIPNFLMGEVLARGQLDGAQERVIEGWLRGGRMGPMFSETPPAMAALYDKERYEDRKQVPGCPLLGEDGRCTIYEQRPYACLAFQCSYPPNREIIGFWFGLSSYLIMLSYLVAEFLMEELGLERTKYREFWQQVDDEATLWDGLQIKPVFAAEMWQGQDPENFVKACFDYLVEHEGELSEKLHDYRRRSLRERLPKLGRWTEEREQALQSSWQPPSEQQPPEAFLDAVQKGEYLFFQDNDWTICEVEGYLLWLHARMMKTYEENPSFRG
ncbi:MAG: YkgJ family cysteine cluster protein [Myxococcales bacterium]|nr:YkgJ family cysteine cluster protein [Myxococcales bacterium]